MKFFNIVSNNHFLVNLDYKLLEQAPRELVPEHIKNKMKVARKNHTVRMVKNSCNVRKNGML